MYEKLFEPIQIGKVKLKNRIVLSPMIVHDVGSQGEVTERMTRYYEERARGGTGLIATGTVLVVPEGRLLARNPSIASDDITYGWTRFVDSIHFHEARACIQLGHGGSQGPSMLKEVVSASAIPRPGRRIPRELTISEIEELIEAFGNAALRSKIVGFDFVEVHGANGYLIQQFYSPLTNRRTDIYGADRNLFAVQILRRIKEKCGEDYPVIFGISGNEFVPGGVTIEDAKVLAARLEENGADAIRVTVGTYETLDRMISPIYLAVSEGFSEFFKAAKEIKKVVSLPVIGGSEVQEPSQAERAIEEGYVDLVLLGRALVTDPEWSKKAREDRVDEIKKCIMCLEGCAAASSQGRNAWCSVNSFHGWEYRFGISPEPAQVKKRVAVVGGGPGGMEAALIAAQRGHDVTLIEEDNELGGTVEKIGAIPPFKKMLHHIAEWYRVQLPKAGVKLELGKRATADYIMELKPDAVILATGSKPLIPDIPGAEKAITADDALLGKVHVGKRIVVVGGGLIGGETALFFAQQEKEVVIVEILSDILRDLDILSMVTLQRLLAESNVRIMVNTAVEQIRKDEVVIRDRFGCKATIPTDTVVLAVGRIPNSELEEQLRGKAKELRAIGDCASPRKIGDAIHEGFAASMFL